MKEYYKIQITSNPAFTEILLAFISEMPFEMFEETDSGIDAYLPNKDYSNEIEIGLKKLQEKFEFKWSKEQLLIKYLLMENPNLKLIPMNSN